MINIRATGLHRALLVAHQIDGETIEDTAQRLLIAGASVTPSRPAGLVWAAGVVAVSIDKDGGTLQLYLKAAARPLVYDFLGDVR